MYKRPSSKDDEQYNSLQSDKLKRTKGKHSIEQIISTLPQLAFTFAILFFAFTTSEATLQDFSGVTFYTSLIAGIIICVIFLILQIGGVEYENWQQDPKTRQYIQIASFSSVTSFIGFNITFWSLFGIFTPIIIICAFIFILSLLIITTAFITK